MSAKHQVEGAAQSPAQTIDQVRELLFGAEQRTMEAQLNALRADMVANREDLERKLAQVQAELKAAIEQCDAEHRNRFAKTGEAIVHIGEMIGALGGR